MSVTSLPTWFLFSVVQPYLSKDYIWYNKEIILQDWHDGQTNLCKLFDWVLWVGFVCNVVLIISLYT